MTASTSKPQGQQAAHSPAPWIAADVGEIRGRIFEIQQASIGGGREIQINGANARRIVACVNACEGFENPAEAIRLLSKGAESVAVVDTLRADNARIIHENENLKREIQQLRAQGESK